VPNEPVVTAHSQTALPRSSNLTRPVLLLVSRVLDTGGVGFWEAP
jgi:hypothetical protein